MGTEEAGEEEEKEHWRNKYDALKSSKQEQNKPKNETNQALKSKSGSLSCKPTPETQAILGCAEATAVHGQWAGGMEGQ